MNDEEPRLVYYTGDERCSPDRLGIISERMVGNRGPRQTASPAEMQRVMDEVMEELRIVDEAQPKVRPVIIVGGGSMPTFDQYQPLLMDKGVKPGKSLGPRNLDNGVPKRRKKGR